MQADVWEGDWGLPSVDQACLQTMTYAKFSGAPLKLKKTNNPWKSPSGFLPVLRHLGENLTKFEDIAHYFRRWNYSADCELTKIQNSDIKAYISILEEKLEPALLFVWWVDSKNYIELTRPWYAKMLPFPQNFFVPGRYQKRALQKLTAMYGLVDNEDSRLEMMVYKDAQECLTMLSNRLGEQEFFFGKSPTSLDASVFALLAPLLKVPFPNARLQYHLQGCTNLVRFVVRILHNYFPVSPQDDFEHFTKPKEKKSTTETDLEFPNRRRNQLLCAIFAVLAMVGYAFSSGLVQVEIVDDGTGTNALDVDSDGEATDDDS